MISEKIPERSYFEQNCENDKKHKTEEDERKSRKEKKEKDKYKHREAYKSDTKNKEDRNKDPSSQVLDSTASSSHSPPDSKVFNDRHARKNDRKEDWDPDKKETGSEYPKKVF